MHRTIILTACALAGMLAACQAVVDDYEVRTCDPDPPASCENLGDADAQFVGCCTDEAEAVWWCENGVLKSRDCGDLACDYDTKLKAMACVK